MAEKKTYDGARQQETSQVHANKQREQEQVVARQLQAVQQESYIDSLVDSPEVIEKLKNPEIISKITQLSSKGKVIDTSFVEMLTQQEVPCDVFIHDYRAAHQLCKSINALAFAYGQHIFFDEGAFDPASKPGQELIVHEVLHIIQQFGGQEKIQRQIGNNEDQKKDPENKEEENNNEDKKEPDSKENSGDIVDDNVDANVDVNADNTTTAEDPELVTPTTIIPDTSLYPYPFSKEYFTVNEGMKFTWSTWKLLKKYYNIDPKQAVEQNNLLKAWIIDTKPKWSDVEALESKKIQPIAYIKDGQMCIEAETKSEAWVHAKKIGNTHSTFTFIPKKPLHKLYGKYSSSFHGNEMIFAYVFASNTAWTNYLYHEKNNIDQAQYDLLLSVTGAQDVYQRLMDIKSAQQRAKSDDFIRMVIFAKRVVYERLGIDQSIDGIYSKDLIDNMETYSYLVKSEEAAELLKEQQEKNAADLEAIRMSVDGDDMGNGYQKYIRKDEQENQEGKLEEKDRTLKVDRNKLALLQKAIEDDKQAKATDYASHDLGLSPVTQKMQDIYFMLSGTERKSLLEMFSEEYWLNDEQEDAVRLLLKNTPVSQRGIIKTALVNTSTMKFTKLYTALEGMMNNSDKNLKDFYTYTERITGLYNSSEVANFEQEFEELKKSAEEYDHGVIESMEILYNYISVSDLVEEMATWSETMYKQVKVNTRINILKVLIAEGGDDNDCIPGLIVNAPESHNPQLSKLLFTKKATTYSRLLGDLNKVQATKVTKELNKRFPKEMGELLSNVINEPSTLTDFEIVINLMPDEIYQSISKEDKVKIIENILDGKWTDDQDEDTILRMLSTTGGPKPDKNDPKYMWQEFKTEENTREDAERLANEQYQIDLEEWVCVRQELYDLMIEKKIISDLYSDVNGEENAKLKREITSLNEAGRDELKKRTDAIPFEYKDIFYNYWSKEMFEEIPTAQERADRIRDIVGDNILEFLMKHTDSDAEKTIILIIQTTPPEQIQDLFKLLKADEGELYEYIDDSTQGAEYKELNQVYTKQADVNFIEGYDDPKKAKKALEELKQSIQYGDEKKNNVVEYSDKGIFNLSDRLLDYYVTFVSVDEKDPITNKTEKVTKVKLIITEQIGSDQFTTKEYLFDPEQLIGVHHLKDDDDLKTKQGEIQIIPAVGLFELENKQINRQIEEFIDIASIALGVGELKAAITIVTKVIAIADIVISAGNLIINSYKEDLSPEFLDIWNKFNLAFGVFSLGHSGYSSMKGKIDDFIDSVKNAYKNGDIDSTQARAMLDDAYAKEELVKTLEDIGKNNSVDDLKKLADDLKTAGKNDITDKVNEAIQNRIKEVEAGKIADEVIETGNAAANKLPEPEKDYSKVVGEIVGEVDDTKFMKQGDRYLKSVDNGPWQPSSFDELTNLQKKTPVSMEYDDGKLLMAFTSELPDGAEVKSYIKFKDEKAYNDWYKSLKDKPNGGKSFSNPKSQDDLLENKDRYYWFFDEAGNLKKPKDYPDFYNGEKPKPIDELFDEKGNLKSGSGKGGDNLPPTAPGAVVAENAELAAQVQRKGDELQDLVDDINSLPKGFDLPLFKDQMMHRINKIKLILEEAAKVGMAHLNKVREQINQVLDDLMSWLMPMAQNNALEPVLVGSHHNMMSKADEVLDGVYKSVGSQILGNATNSAKAKIINDCIDLLGDQGKMYKHILGALGEDSLMYLRRCLKKYPDSVDDMLTFLSKANANDKFTDEIIKSVLGKYYQGSMTTQNIQTLNKFLEKVKSDDAFESLMNLCGPGKHTGKHMGRLENALTAGDDFEDAVKNVRKIDADAEKVKELKDAGFSDLASLIGKRGTVSENFWKNINPEKLKDYEAGLKEFFKSIDNHAAEGGKRTVDILAERYPDLDAIAKKQGLYNDALMLDLAKCDTYVSELFKADNLDALKELFKAGTFQVHHIVAVDILHKAQSSLGPYYKFAADAKVTPLDFNGIEDLANSIMLMSRKNIKIGDKIFPMGVHTNHDLYSGLLAGYIDGLFKDILKQEFGVNSIEELSKRQRKQFIEAFDESLKESIQKVKSLIEQKSVADTQNVNDLFGNTSELKEWVKNIDDVDTKDKIFKYIEGVLKTVTVE